MASKAGAIKAGSAFVEIFADKSPLVRGLRAAEKSIKQWGASISSFGKKMMGIGTAITAPLIAAATHAAHYAHEIAKISEITGAGVESLQGLSFAADQNGVSMQSLGKSLIFMHKNLYALNKGSKSAVESFGKLGLTAKDLEGLSVDNQFMLIADRLASIENPTDRAALALKVFGRSGASLLPLLNQGKGAILAYKNELERLGATMSSEDIEAASEFHKELKKMWWVIKNGLTNAIGSALIPILKEWAGKIIEIVGTVNNWIKQNQGLVRTVFLFGASLVAGGAAIYAFGNALIWCSKIFALMRGAFAILKTALMFIISPIGMVTVAIGSLVGIILYFTGYGAQLLNWLGACFNSLREDATNAIGGISAALAKGDLGLAARIGWLFVKMEWLKAKQWMLGFWITIKTAILEVWFAIVYSIAVAWDAVVFGIQVAWAETVAFIGKIWVQAGSFLKGAWITTVQFFKNLWAGFKMFWGSTVDWMAKKLMGIWIWWKKLTDPTFDEKAARKQIDDQFAQDKADRTANYDDQILQNDKDADADRLKLETDTQNNLAEIEGKRMARRKDARNKFDAGLQAANQYVEEGLQKTIDKNNADRKAVADELANAKADFNASVAKAKEPVQPKQKIPPPKKDWEVQSGLTKASATGTFSAFGLGQLGAGGVMQKIADFTQRTAEATEEMAENDENNDIEFGD